VATTTASQGIRAVMLLIVIGASSLASDRRDPIALSADLKIEVNGPLLADLPLQFRLTITNTGKIPLAYWCGGPASYPSAHLFRAEVKDASGRTRWLPLHNGQHMRGRGTTCFVAKTQLLPAAGDPLGPGTYTIRVVGKPQLIIQKGKMSEQWPAMIAEPITVTIKEDRRARIAAEKTIVLRADEEPFLWHVARVYSLDPVVETWLRQLLDPDPKVAFLAVGHLQHVRRLPPGGDASLKEAALKHCRPKSGKLDLNLLHYISLIAGQIRTDEALDVVLMIVEGCAPEWPSTTAVEYLAGFPQKRAEDALISIAEKKDAAAYWDAINGLAKRGNRLALDPLKRAAADLGPERRTRERRFFAIRALSSLRKYPEAREILNNALSDPDPDVKRCAEMALKGAVAGQEELPYYPGRAYPN
jgi:HEAT repeat protein